MNYRNKHYLDTRMPKETPQWMSAHDFEWLKDERLSAFPHALPDPLIKHMEFNQIFTIPFNALSQLVAPAVKMEHIEWHHGSQDGNDRLNGFSAQTNYNNLLNYYSYYNDEQYEYDDDDTAFAGDYIIDGTKWVVSNEWTTDFNIDELENSVFSAGKPRVAKESGNGQGDPGDVLSTRCMLVFGRQVCLCEFINWVYDKTKPLYKCRMAGNMMQANNPQNGQPMPMPQESQKKMLQKELAAIHSIEQQLEQQKGGQNGQAPFLPNGPGGSQNQQNMQMQGMPNQNGAPNQNQNGQPQNQNENEKENEQEKQEKEEEKEKEEDKEADKANSQGWSNSYTIGAGNYYYDSDYKSNDGEYYQSNNDEYYKFDQDYYYESNNNDNDDNDYYFQSNYDYNYQYESDEKNMDNENIASIDNNNIEPNWRAEGEGFTQTVYIGVNTFSGLMLLSLFFGMITCSFICCWYHFSRLLCKKNLKNETDTDYQTDELIAIEENVKFNLEQINVDDVDINVGKQYQNE